MLSIEQIRPELTWKLRQQVLYPAEALNQMAMEEDNNGYHFGAFKDNKLLGIVSLFQCGYDYQFRKFAVIPEAQGQGIGSAILDHLTDFVVREGGKKLWCNARLSAIGFYSKHGFYLTGVAFNRNGFDYEIMEKLIENRNIM